MRKIEWNFHLPKRYTGEAMFNITLPRVSMFDKFDHILDVDFSIVLFHFYLANLFFRIERGGKQGWGGVSILGFGVSVDF